MKRTCILYEERKKKVFFERFVCFFILLSALFHIEC